MFVLSYEIILLNTNFVKKKIIGNTNAFFTENNDSGS